MMPLLGRHTIWGIIKRPDRRCDQNKIHLGNVGWFVYAAERRPVLGGGEPAAANPMFEDLRLLNQASLDPQEIPRCDESA